MESLFHDGLIFGSFSLINEKKNKKQKNPQRDQSISRFSNGTSEQFHALLNENENTLNVLTENNILTKSSQNKKKRKKKKDFPLFFSLRWGSLCGECSHVNKPPRHILHIVMGYASALSWPNSKLHFFFC